MKIRNGFVSNSSSSSFVAIVTPKAFEAALELIKDNRYKKILKGIVTKETFIGQPVLIVQEMVDSGGYSSTFGEGADFEYEQMGLTESEMFPEDGEFCAMESIFEYEKALEKLKRDKKFKQDILMLDDMGVG